jgi:type IV pilus assembly protein PilY1
MKLHFRFSLPALLAALAAVASLAGFAGAAQAATTSIATVPLLNIDGTGAVKPNLMLLFDNSGSMDWHYLPDSVGTGSVAQCRARASMRDSTSTFPNTLCSPGHPPFNAADFNRVYYNPATRYQPPVTYNGTPYPEMTAANSTNWTAVPMDGFSSRAINMAGTTQSSATAKSNLTNGFPDLQWCDTSGKTNCRRNTTTYNYPDATFTFSDIVYTNPYYYNIKVAQYCSDVNLTDCVSTAVGAAAPTGYTYPAKVRWCDTLNLNNCQAKQVGNFKYPSFSKPIGAVMATGTIVIGQSDTSKQMIINKVTVGEPAGEVVITNSTTTSVTAGSGTDTPAKQQAVASLLAASIMAKTGLTNQYWACVRTPTGTTTVNPCSSYGINLTAENVVVVIALDCASTANKAVTNCSPATDNTNAGWLIKPYVTAVANAPAVAYVPSTALITVSGAGANQNNNKIASINWDGKTLANNVAFASKATAATVASNIVSAIGTNTAGYRAYIGGNNVTPTCQANNNPAIVCLVKTSATNNPAAPTEGTVTNGGIGFNNADGVGYTPAAAATTDSIPATGSTISPGSSPASTFERVDIVATDNSYPRAIGRTDCAGATCTYAEEMTNFANWYAYYKTRIQMTKTAVGLAFSTVTSGYRVGLSRMSTSGAGGAIEIKPNDFTGTQRSDWYTKFYATTTSGSTPTRTSLDNVGRMFANLDPYNYTSGNEVIQFPCQQNFILLTTDGYWNQSYGGTVADNDNAEDSSRFCTILNGCTDGRTQSAPSLADVALHWYNGGSSTTTVSLRPAIDPMNGLGSVRVKNGENTHLHVNTFTMGLGIDGVMTYDENYDSNSLPGTDFYNVTHATPTGCPWNGGGAYVWPDPLVGSPSTTTVQERVDDLWHAAVNGHGKYFSANDPQAVQAGMAAVIASIKAQTGAASSAATSTPNISLVDNDIFTDTFTTADWNGEMLKKSIDPATGAVSTTAAWSTSKRLGLAVAAATDTRVIKMLDTGGNTLKDFRYASLSSAEKAWFDNKCTALPQCAQLTTAEKAIVNSGANIVDWLRGQQRYGDDRLMRAYKMSVAPEGSTDPFTPLPVILGDIASSKPAYVRVPTKSYVTAGYSQFKANNANRAATVYTAANDGMLHAFASSTGDELWAYVPRITMQKLYKQTSTNYATNHQYTTDGSPEIADVQINNVWRTVLVAGLNSGGRGYYALDVTDPANPVALWELCADPAICNKNDPDIGLTFGNPQFGYWQGKWVAYLTSGYNNVSGVDGVNVGATGHGFLYIVDVADGTVLKKVDTGNGSVTTPSGLAKISSISNNPFTDPVTTFIYGGDNTGQMWRFDLTSASTGVVGVVKMGDAGVGQPVTTKPDITQCLVTDVVNNVSQPPRVQRVVAFGTGRLLDVGDIADTTTQSLYMLKDSGSAIANIRGASMVQQSLSVIGDANTSTTYGVTNRAVNLSTKDGWFIDMNRKPGERINLDPQIVNGGLNVVTTVPTTSTSCLVGGSSNVYQFSVCTGSSVNVPADGTGTPTNPNQPDTIYPAGKAIPGGAAVVGFIIVRLANGVTEMVYTNAKGDHDKDPLQQPSAQSSRKVGWRSVNGE